MVGFHFRASLAESVACRRIYHFDIHFLMELWWGEERKPCKNKVTSSEKKKKKKTYTKIIVYPYRSWVHLIMNGCNSFHRKATESSLQLDAFHSEPFSELNHPHWCVCKIWIISLIWRLLARLKGFLESFPTFK